MALVLAASWTSPARSAVRETPTPPICAPDAPAARYGSLYAAVETARVFPDSKTFADAEALEPPAAILKDWRSARPDGRAALAGFVASRFEPPAAAGASLPESLASLPLAEHIRRLWPYLVRRDARPDPRGSRLALPRPFVVPGGRFRELYYWDSYFTSLGLVLDGRRDLALDLLEDFGSLVDRFGFVPNGARTYYLSRSQPPLYYRMIEAAGPLPAALRSRLLRRLLAEHAFWMRGASALPRGVARGHVVRLEDGALLNRYFDSCPRPRDESYREDLALARASGRDPSDLYRNLRAAAESGWDFSSRWLAPSGRLASIRTLRVLPVDLNSFLYGQEREIATLAAGLGRRGTAARFRRAAARRRAALEAHFWREDLGVYVDYDLDRGGPVLAPTAAGLAPLFEGVASAARGRRATAFAAARLLAPGGVRTSLRRTGQQWDAPNGWAPLQWIAEEGARRYGAQALGREIRSRFEAVVEREYRASGRLLEKYDVEERTRGGGGEYPLQDGFGWTNGVVRAFLSIDAAASRRAAGPLDAGGPPVAPLGPGRRRSSPAGRASIAPASAGDVEGSQGHREPDHHHRDDHGDQVNALEHGSLLTSPPTEAATAVGP